MPELISIDRTLKEHTGKIYKFIPKFLIRFLEKLIHQKQINDFVIKNKDKFGQDFIYEVLRYFNIKINFFNIEKVPKRSRYIFVSNHPLGGIDGVAFIHLVYRFFGEVKAIVNELLLYFRNLEPVFEGVNVFGKFTKTQNENLDKLYSSHKHIIIFPAGTVSRKIKGKIQDVEWQKSFIRKAIEYQRNIVPVFISGRNTKFFYNFANFRKFLGFKFPLEMLLLPDQMFRYNGKSIDFYFGDVIPYTTFTKDKPINYWKNYVRNIVYSLKR